MPDINFPNAIFDEIDFFGRAEALRKIKQIFLSRDRVPVLIIGERRIGKTSLQNIAVQQLLSANPGQFLKLSIEPRGIVTFVEFTQAVLRRLIVSQLQTTSGISLQTRPESIDEFEVALTQIIAASNQSIILCIDEFDEIVRASGRELANIIGLIYYLIEQTDFPLFFFLTMTTIPAELQNERPSSLVSMAQVIELGPLSLAEMDHLVKEISQSRLEWSDASLQELFRLAGGHPYFTKLILAYLLQENQGANGRVTVTEELVRQAGNEAVCDPRAEHVNQNLYKVHFTPEEKEIVLFLAQRREPIATSELNLAGKTWLTTVKRLVKRHYLKFLPGGDKFDFNIAFLGDWLRNWLEFDEECERFSLLQKLLTRPEIEVDEPAGQVRLNGQEIRLSAQEFKMMRCLARKAGQLVTRDQLVEAVWGSTDGVTDQMIDTTIYRLRKNKLNDQFGQYIETKPGQGFVLHKAILITA